MDAELRELCWRLRGLLAEATPGLLQRCGHDRGGCSCGMVFAQDSDCFIADFSLSGDDEMRSHRPEADTRKANAALHVAAVNALPRLLDTIAAQAAELEGLRKDAARWRFVSDGTSRGAVDFCVTRCDWRLPREDMHKILSGAGADTAIDTALADSDAAMAGGGEVS